MNLTRTFAIVVLLVLSTASAIAASPRDSVSDSLRRAGKDLEPVVKNVQTALMMSGRWTPTPRGSDLQLCQALQSFQSQLQQLSRDNGSQTYSYVQTQLQQVQMQAQSVDTLLAQTGMTGNVLSSWSKVKADLAGANQSLFFGPAQPDWNSWYNGGAQVSAPGTNPFGPNPYAPNPYYGGNRYGGNRYGGNPYGGNPYGNPYSGNPFAPSYGQPVADVSGQISTNVKNAERSLDRLVQQTSTFLQMKGKWPPPGGSAEMQLCQQLQSFQAQLRKFSADVSGRVSYASLQGDVQQLSFASQSIDAQLAQVSPTADVLGNWGLVKSQLSAVYQSFYSGGSQQFWAR